MMEEECGGRGGEVGYILGCEKEEEGVFLFVFVFKIILEQLGGKESFEKREI